MTQLSHCFLYMFCAFKTQTSIRSLLYSECDFSFFFLYSLSKAQNPRMFYLSSFPLRCLSFSLFSLLSFFYLAFVSIPIFLPKDLKAPRAVFDEGRARTRIRRAMHCWKRLGEKVHPSLSFCVAGFRGTRGTARKT